MKAKNLDPKKLKELVLDFLEFADKSRVTESILRRMESAGITLGEIKAAYDWLPVDPNKIVIGTWVRVFWYDSEPTWGLVLDVSDGKSTSSAALKCFYPDTDETNSHATVSQVVEVRALTPPAD